MELKLRIDQLIEDIQQIVPLLVMDRWQEANGKLPVVFEKLQDFMKCAAIDHRFTEELPELIRCLKQALWCMQMQDSIQLADIFVYELGQMFQDYQQVIG